MLKTDILDSNRANKITPVLIRATRCRVTRVQERVSRELKANPRLQFKPVFTNKVREETKRALEAAIRIRSGPDNQVLEVSCPDIQDTTPTSLRFPVATRSSEVSQDLVRAQGLKSWLVFRPGAVKL